MYRKGQKKFFWVVAGFIILVVLGYNFFPRLFTNLGLPIWNLRDKLAGTTKSLTSVFESKKNLTEENNILEKEIQKLRRKLLLSKLYEDRNKELEGLLGIKNEGGLIAKVLSKPPFSPYDTFILNKGAREKISIGNKIYVEEDFLVGEIIETYGNTSKAELLSAPGKRIEVELLNGFTTEAIGKGGGNFIMEIPREVEIKKGEAVQYPAGNLTVLGIVEYIESEMKNPFKKVYFRLPLNLGEIQWVKIRK